MAGGASFVAVTDVAVIDVVAVIDGVVVIDAVIVEIAFVTMTDGASFVAAVSEVVPSMPLDESCTDVDGE